MHAGNACRSPPAQEIAFRRGCRRARLGREPPRTRGRVVVATSPRRSGPDIVRFQPTHQIRRIARDIAGQGFADEHRKGAAAPEFTLELGPLRRGHELRGPTIDLDSLATIEHVVPERIAQDEDGFPSGRQGRRQVLRSGGDVAELSVDPARDVGVVFAAEDCRRDPSGCRTTTERRGSRRARVPPR